MSVVSRVTRDDVEKWSMFPNEKVWIFENTFRRRFLEKPVAP